MKYGLSIVKTVPYTATEYVYLGSRRRRVQKPSTYLEALLDSRVFQPLCHFFLVFKVKAVVQQDRRWFFLALQTLLQLVAALVEVVKLS